MMSQFPKQHVQMLKDYFSLLRFPSIATDPFHASDVRACADWLVAWMKQRGLAVELWESAGAPTLFATHLKAGPSCDTVLFYAHYDVQPVDPLELWTTPPFEPTLREGSIYARGASDDKGQCFYMLCAITDFLRIHGHFPVNIKILIEGEEESGSRSLTSLLPSKTKELEADHLLIVDSSLEAIHLPSITLGARGIVTMTVTLQEGQRDLHSGLCGGLAANPNRALVALLAKCYDDQGGVAIPGFYDAIVPPTTEERSTLSNTFDVEEFKKNFGFAPQGMEQGVDPLTANWFRPTLEINGMHGGYSGPGFKTVIPAQASAKLSCRLVPQQQPEHVLHCVIQFLRTHTPLHMRLTVDVHPGHAPGFRCSPQSKIATLASQSYTDVFGAPCKHILTGGSIPIVPQLMKAAGAETVLIGTALPTNCIHAPNEHFSLTSFIKGYEVISRILERFIVI